jgi:hypothetical protein
MAVRRGRVPWPWGVAVWTTSTHEAALEEFSVVPPNHPTPTRTPTLPTLPYSPPPSALLPRLSAFIRFTTTRNPEFTNLSSLEFSNPFVGGGWGNIVEETETEPRSPQQ